MRNAGPDGSAASLGPASGDSLCVADEPEEAGPLRRTDTRHWGGRRMESGTEGLSL